MLCSGSGWPLDFLIASGRERPLHGIGKAWSRPEADLPHPISKPACSGVPVNMRRVDLAVV
jgi:hypothetical protein